MTKSEFEQKSIPIIEIFQSISGEGISAGNLVTFVRTAGCDLRCSWCDTKYSFPESGKGVSNIFPEEIVETLNKFGSREIICTGGEPLEDNKAKRFLPLYLASYDFSVRIETSGGSPLYTVEELNAFDIDRDEVIYCMDIKCPESGMQDNNRFENIPLLQEEDEIKFVVANQNDIQYAFEVVDKYKEHLASNDIALNFSPVFGAIDPVTIVEFLKENTSFFEKYELWPRLNLQLHKFIWPPHQRGV